MSEVLRHLSKLECKQTFDYDIEMNFIQPNSSELSDDLFLFGVYLETPVMCENYYFRGKVVSTYESGVLELVEREANANLDEYKEIVDQVWRLSDPTNSSDKAKTKEGAKRIKAEFKEVMMKVAIDQMITLPQLRRLTTQQYQMFVAFCNCKFSLSLPIDAGAGYEQVLQQVNQNIQDVVQRAANLRKNEEFLKKKWKEFLKFLKALAKQESPLAGKPGSPSLFQQGTRLTPHVRRVPPTTGARED